MTLTTGTAGPLLTPEQVESLLIKPVLTASVALNPLCSRVLRPTAPSVRLPAVTADPTAAWVAEGAEIPISDLTTAEVDVVTSAVRAATGPRWAGSSRAGRSRRRSWPVRGPGSPVAAVWPAVGGRHGSRSAEWSSSAHQGLGRGLLELGVGPAHLPQRVRMTALGQLEELPLPRALGGLGEQFPVQ